MTAPEYSINAVSRDKLYLQGKPSDYTTQAADSVVDSVQRTKTADVDVMSIPYSDEGATLIMRGMSGTTGKIMLSGTATASTPADATWFMHTLDTYVDASMADVVTYYDGLRDWSVEVAPTDVGYDLHAGDVYIIKWKITLTIGAII